MSNIVFGIICGILEFIVFVFIVISVPSDILRNKNELSWVDLRSLEAHRQCFSFWGTKRCGPHKHNPYKAQWRGFPTKKVYDLVTAAVAFDIAGIATSLVCFITCMTLACGCTSAVIPLVFALLTVVFVIITIGCLLAVWYTELTPDVVETRLTKLYNLGFASILVVAGWCLQVIIFILLIIAACCCSSGSKKKDEGDADNASGKGSSNKEQNEPVDRDSEHSEL